MNLDKVIVLDIECLPNYLLIMFKKVTSGEVIYFEKVNDSSINLANILHIINNYTIVTFNGNDYDMTIIEATIAGFTNSSIHNVSKMIIDDNMKPWQVRKQVGIAAIQSDHIDLINVAPLKASLKIYMGRLNAPKMQDLPIDPYEDLDVSEIPKVRNYCENDLDGTILLLKSLEGEIDLRSSMSDQYGVDLRSKSDAQIAEAVIKAELEKKYDIKATRPKIKEGTKFLYSAPENIEFQTDILKDILRQYTTLPFIVDKTGYTSFNFEIGEADRIKSGKNKGKLPESKKQLKFKINNTNYTIGSGGIHSCEKKVRHTNKNHIIRDYDVASFYPRIILNNNLAPKHLGMKFLKVYESIVKRRLKAKREGNKVVNESLKITINGSFGKFGNKWSALYSPDLMLQVTITGQLSLLMLIERMELAGIEVISANTDGIVVKMDKSKESIAEDIVSDWEFETDYEMESTDYLSLNSRDVNNYIAIKKDSIKGKGAYVDRSDTFYTLRNNPSYQICSEAVKLFLKDDIPIEKTIRDSKDITQFVTIRTVNGGAIKNGELLGKAIRWYYGAEELDAIYYSTNGNKVPKSDGAVPLMQLPDKFPEDIDYDWYINEAYSILKDIGYK